MRLKNSAALFVAIIAGCGGGGGSSSNAAPDQPTARISTPSSVADERTELRLDGSGSSASQGTIVTYAWTAVNNENVQLEIANANQAIATLRIGEAIAASRVTVRLAVTGSNSQTGTAQQELDIREIDEARLPPDPGSNGRSTVEGVDANGNGIRDDVERAIYDRHKDSMEDRAVMMMAADKLEDAVMVGVAGSPMNPDTVADDVSRGVDCLFKRPSLQPRQSLAVLKALVLNTPERLAAYEQYDSSRDGTVQQPTEATSAECMAFAP